MQAHSPADAVECGVSVGSVYFCQGLCAEACRLIQLLMQWNVVSAGSVELLIITTLIP